MKRTVTPEKAQRVFYSTQKQAIIIELLKIEQRQFLYDHKFNDPIMNNHRKRIQESTEFIQREIEKQIQGKDLEYFQFSHCPALYSVLEFFMFMDIEGLEDTLKQIEELKGQINNQIEELDKKQVA